MPTLEALADNGLRYNRFHTTALCSPTRTALLTGRNHHVNNAGAIMELATAFPGNTGIRPNSVAPLAQILRLNGYSTAAFGKYHETPPWEASVSGPYDRWPTGSGFDKFYGFIGGETNQWAPAVYDGVTRVELAARPELPLHHRHDQPGDRLGALPAGADARTSRSTCTSRPAPPTRRTTRPRSTSRSTRASSTRAGTSCARRRWRGRSSWAWCRAGTKLTARPAGDPGLGLARRPTRSGSSRGRWRPSPASPSTPTTRSAGWSRRSGTWASSTTRCSSTSSATTARAPRAARTAATTRSWR